MIKSKKLISIFVSAAMLITMLSSFTTVAFAGEIAPDTSNDLINETFDEEFNSPGTDIWGYSYVNMETREAYTTDVHCRVPSSKRLVLRSNAAQSEGSYVGGFYGKMNKKVPLNSSYTDDESYVDIGKNTKLVATFKTDNSKLDVKDGKIREVSFGFHNSTMYNSTDSTIDINTQPYGRKGFIGAKYSYAKNYAFSNLLMSSFDGSESTIVSTDTYTSDDQCSYFKLELTLTDENGDFLRKPTYKVSYRHSVTDDWTPSESTQINEKYKNDLGYIDCLYFHLTGSTSYLYVDDVNVYVTYDYETKCDAETAYFYTPEDSDCFAVVAAYGSDNTIKDVITDDSLIRGVNKVSLDKLDTEGADYIKVMLWKDIGSLEPWCTSATYELEELE